MPMSAMQFFADATYDQRLTVGLRQLLVLLVTVAGVFIFLPSIIYTRRTFSSSIEWRFRSLAVIAAVFGLVISVAGAISIYAVLAYPDLKRAFGGGKKPVVQIALRGGEVPVAWEFTGVPVASDRSSVGPVLLVLERGDSVVVAAIAVADKPWYRARRHESTTAIAREMIAAIHYKKRH